MVYRPVVGFEGLYEVSEAGWIFRRCSRGDTLVVCQASLNPKGYLKINLRAQGRQWTRTVHRIVAEAFIENPLRLPQVNHIDGCKTNNQRENLEWCDQEHNISHAITLGLCTPPKPVVGRHEKTGKVVNFPSISSAVKAGFRHKELLGCCLGKRKTHGGYRWNFSTSYLQL